jgi:hypothetical protein
MKKTLLLGMVGLASVLSTYGQSTILLDNYQTSGPYITDQASAPLGAGWTMGLYYALGDVTGSVAADPSGFADPGSLGGGLALGTGAGSTAAFSTSTFGLDGTALGGSFFAVPGTSGNGGELITVMITAYNGGDYLSSLIRGHSQAFTMTTSSSTSPAANAIGADMPGGFSVVPVPEPTTLALAGLGAAALMIFRRRRA